MVGTDLDRMAAYTSEFAKQMRAIAADLWNNADGSAAAESQPPVEESGLSGNQPNNKNASVPEKKTKRTVDVPSFEKLLKSADETVEWTEILTHDKPIDGLTGQDVWDYLKKHAAGVLNGDLNEYVEILQHMNPLGDLTPFASGIQIRACSAERLEASFQCMPAALDATEEKRRVYVCGMCLRIARDLMALLPVTQVGVEALRIDGTEMKVTYTRDQLRKRNFFFTDPVAFTRECIESD